MLFYFFIIVIGLVVGSFLNVVILRLHSSEKIALSMSHCPQCRHDLEAADLVPVLSFLTLKGKCRYCRAKISWQYPLVELMTALAFVLVAYKLMGNLSPSMIFYNGNLFWQWLTGAIFACFLMVIFVYDWRWYLILDRVTVPAMIAALILNLLLGFDFLNLLLAAAVGLAVFGVQYVLSRGKWIGGGDLRLGFLMGLMLGWPNILVALLFSYVLGAIIGIGLIVMGKKKMQSAVPFGTFLALGTFVAYLWGEMFWQKFF